MRIKAVMISVCLLLASMVLAADQETQPTPETSKSLAFATYEETNGRVVIIVGSMIAGLAATEKYMPLQIAVGTSGKGPQLEVTPDRFQLIDSKGNIYNTVSVHDVSNEPGVQQYAKSYSEQNPLQTTLEFSMKIERVASNFYPQDGGEFYVASYLGRDSYLEDLLFFPNLGDAMEGVLTLQFLTPGMDQAVELRFEIPLKNEKKDKQKKNLDKQESKADSQETEPGS